MWLKTYNPVYSKSLDKGLSTRKPIEWQIPLSQLEVQIRDYLSTGKYYLLKFIKLEVYIALKGPLYDLLQRYDNHSIKTAL